MRFTKLGHSCVRLEKDGAVLVIDPGTFTDAAAALAGAAAVLVTHQHPDHPKFYTFLVPSTSSLCESHTATAVFAAGVSGRPNTRPGAHAQSRGNSLQSRPDPTSRFP